MKSIHKCSIKDGVPEGSNLGHSLFALHNDKLPENIIHNTAIYADDTTLISTYDQASDLCHKFEFASGCELTFNTLCTG